MNKIAKLFSLFLLTLLVGLPLHAKSDVGKSMTEKVEFNPELANRQFDKLTQSLKSETVSIKKINRTIGQLEVLSGQASECVDEMSAKISKIDSQIKLIEGTEGSKPANAETTEVVTKKEQTRVDSKYLNEQKKKLVDRQAKCQLLQIRARETITTYRNKALALQQQIAFTRGEPIFKRIELVHEDIKKLSIPKLSTEMIPWDWLTSLLVMAIFLGISCSLVYGIRSTLIKYVRRRTMGIGQSLLVFIALCLAALLLGEYHPYVDETDNLLLTQSLRECLTIVLVLILTQLVMSIRRLDIGLKWYGFDTDFLRHLLQAIILLSGIHIIGNTILTLLESGQVLIEFFNSIVMMISLLATVYFSFQFYINHQRFFSNGNQFKIISRTIWIVVFTLIALDLTGYNILAVNTADIFFSFLLVSGLSLVLLKGFGQAYHYLNYAPNAQAFLRRYFGYPITPPHFELALLKVIIQIIIVFALIYTFAYLIGEASYFIDNFLDYFISGFVFAGYQFHPFHWLIGLLVFCMFVILSRYISRHYSLQYVEDDEEDTQVALASILLYIGFSFAVIMGLLVAGFSFTSLAIIAGALSVGIGLGLQSSVNNFFSGLILLIEKPIKVGDRIAIGEVEGFVKKVRVRSTQIETPAKEDIIIPNSDLITQQVTNFMFANRSWRVKCAVGVAYGSDTDLVRKVLYEVAENHSDVLTTRGQKPMVLFQGFGDSTLNFELWCMIRDVNKKYTVTSDLNFAIDKAFRKHNIVIAFPQRDVHIKYDSPPHSGEKDQD